VDLPKRRIVLDLTALDPAFRLPVIDIPGDGAKLVIVKDRSLFEDYYIDKILSETSKAGFLAKMIGKSLELIEAADPVLASRLKRMIRWYVPLSTPGPRTHNSMSVRGLQGVMFISEAYDDIRLAEAIVHEFYHTELYVFQEWQTLHRQVRNEVFYSPWRSDPRPLVGLIHALYVFSGVADFIRRAELLPVLADYVPYLRNRRVEVVLQLRLGLAQIPGDRLEIAGKRLIRLIEKEVEGQEAELGRPRGHLPRPLAEHLANWKAENPGLVHRIQLPNGVEVER
ncbi:MAG: HEXXH motif-containing putative peptide modification protein, partial [Dehalococcoidia bacterium]